MRMYRFILVLFCIVIPLFLSACTDNQSTASNTLSSSPQSSDSPENSIISTESLWIPGETIVPEFKESINENNVKLDISSTEKGYVGVSAVNDNALKFQVIFGDTKYNYDLTGDDTPIFIPLQLGSGTYNFRVLENVSDNKYAEIFSYSADVTIENEFEPYIRSNTMVRYKTDSLIVKKAAELAENVKSDSEFVSKVYEYLKDAIKYDYEFAESNPKMYYPEPDKTLTTGKGICFDYAAASAAMLRSKGIPTKLITGYISDDTYHAWNMIYLQDSGWITVEIRANENKWQIIDVTLASTGGAVGDGTNYVERYVF